MTVTRLHLRASGTTRPSDEQLCSALYGLAALSPSITWKDDHAVVTIASWSKPAIVFVERTLHYLGPFKIEEGKLEITKLEIVPQKEWERADQELDASNGDHDDRSMPLHQARAGIFPEGPQQNK